jgi:hypothetical protein
MGIPRFFKLPKNKRFNYQPLYYNPEKEERENRNRMIAKELGIESDKLYTPKIKHGSFRSVYKKEHKVNRMSNIRLVLIIIVLLFLAYLILYR